MPERAGAGLQAERVPAGAICAFKSRPRVRVEHALALLLFAAACAATLAISSPGRRFNEAFEAAVFLLAAVASWRRAAPPLAPAAALAGIAALGFAQLLAGATVYRWETWQAGLRFAALASIAWAACVVFRRASVLRGCLRALIWFGTLLSVVSVLAYLTSPGKVLWIFPAAYPDNWGPFPSRNNFAQFLELSLPVALVYAARGRSFTPSWTSFWPAAAMLAAGFASASRAGAILLVIETVAVQFLLSVPLRRSLILAAAVASLSVLVGAQTLAARFAQPDPLEYRREIFRSAGAMVAEHPWAGFGLGTFPTVYPAFALFDSGAAVEHAHNDWLEWAAEGGVPFAALWLLLAASIAREAIRSVWGVGVLAVFLHAIVDYPFARFGVAAWAFLLIGALLARGEREVGLSGYLTGEI